MHDFVIIGSGVSGGKIAQLLSAGGARCLVLEAGSEFSASTFPRHELDYSARMFWGGGLEITADGRLGLLRAKCLGGTSVVNQALLDRFDDDAWNDWRSRSGVEFFSRDAMERHYGECEKSLSISEIPERHYNRNARTFIRAFETKGYGWKPLHRAQGDCALEKGSDCIVCLGGCPRDSKQSSLITGIRDSRAKGTEIRCDFEVNSIEESGDGVRVRGRHRGQPAEVVAGRAVLAAGAIGNSALLLRSGYGSRLPALGTRFACHPQFMTYAMYDEPVDAHKGAFQAVKSEDAKLRAAGFKLENVFAPPIGTAMLIPGYGAEHLRRMKKYRYLASMEVALRDEASGRILVRGGKTVIEKSLTASDREKCARGMKLVEELFGATGAREIITCEQTFGLHLMGGCPMGTDSGASVVSPEFTLHGSERVFAADSSVFPAAPGINPSFTIMALSHRAAERMLAK